MLAVNEMFLSIQGESKFTGTPAVFIRLQGCGVGCGWCDTKHTWLRETKNKIGLSSLIAKTEDAPTYARLSPDTIMKEIQRLAPDYPAHVVITGGEPLEQDLLPLVRHIAKNRHTIQIETSGTVKIPEALKYHAFITVSPKIGMNRPVLKQALQQADEIKVPVGSVKDIYWVKANLGKMRTPIWLQPLSTSKKATALCVETAMEYGYKVSLQTHKYLNVR